MAKARWVKNLNGATQPLIQLLLFAASGDIEAGALIEKTANGATEFVEMDADFAMSADVAIAHQDIKSGDRKGYYEAIIPRPGDVFAFELDAAASPAVGAPVYYNTSKTVKLAGTNILGNICGQDHYPPQQGRLTVDGAPDSGTTIKETKTVFVTIKQSNSVYSSLQT